MIFIYDVNFILQICFIQRNQRNERIHSQIAMSIFSFTNVHVNIPIPKCRCKYSHSKIQMSIFRFTNVSVNIPFPKFSCQYFHSKMSMSISPFKNAHVNIPIPKCPCQYTNFFRFTKISQKQIFYFTAFKLLLNKHCSK